MTPALRPLLAALLLAFPATPAVGQPPTRVVVGADRLLPEFAALVQGRRVALVSNHSGVLADGTHLADALHGAPGVTLRVLFGMDHDIRTNDYSAPRDPEHTVDARTGVPKHNLYGARHQPTPEELDGVDVVVVDLQDVGARFYEHVNILGFVMEAAAARGIPVVVLDRPNPVGGGTPDGWVTDEATRFRFGSYAPIPVLHGLTIGELARMYVGEGWLRRGRAPELHVVPMRGWRRTMWYDDTGLPWRKPSPNLLTLASLTAYLGTCLFEAVNVSEGRGSDTPFEVIGAPWLDHAAVVRDVAALGLPGLAFDTVTFTPTQRAFHGRPPEYAGEPLRGVRIRVTDRTRAQPYRGGIALLWAVHRRHADRLVWQEAVLDRLVATPRLTTALAAGAAPAAIFASWEAEVADFTRRASPYRLYP